MVDTPIMQPGSNIWRVGTAQRAHIIVDAEEYFTAVREAMLKAERRILLIGWDFDTRINIGRHKRKRNDPPNRLGDFILWLANNRPELEIKILKWGQGAMKMLTRGSAMVTAARWAMHDSIQFKFDTAHPLGCSHHQKIVSIDDNFAVCGGIDMTSDRWDTNEHAAHDPRRKRPNGKPYDPWHDVTMLVDGDAARALADLGRNRWAIAGGDPLPAVDCASDPWPETIEPEFHNVEIGIARTRAEYGEVEEVREVEHLFIDMIASAKHHIYIENQYFTARKIAEAIAKRLEDPHPPEIVMVNPVSADGWLEQKAMDGARVQLIRSLGKKPGSHRFGVYSPINAGEEDIYVHAKLMIVDDRMVRVGSANMNNRSLGLDSECDLLIDAAAQSGDAVTPAIRTLRYRLIAEHTGSDPDTVRAALEGGQSMIDFIHAQPQIGHRLVRLELEELSDMDQAIADNELLDPESPEAMFEPLSKRGLFRKRVLRAPD